MTLDRLLTVIVHNIDHVRAALSVAQEARCSAKLFSAEGASATLGAGYWAALEDLARGEYSAVDFSLVLDCGDRVGDAQAALRAGCTAIRFTGAPGVAEKLADIAGQLGAVVTDDPLPDVDLQAAGDAAAACRAQICDDTREAPSTGGVVSE